MGRRIDTGTGIGPIQQNSVPPKTHRKISVDKSLLTCKFFHLDGKDKEKGIKPLIRVLYAPNKGRRKMVNPESEPQLVFGKGTEVEVSSDEEGFKGAWYRATIVEYTPKSASKKRKKALVAYKTLLTEDGLTPLTEYVDPAYVRPLPPNEKNTGEDFEENDAVDARYRDGWWTGIVRKILDNSRYRVYFDNPPDVIEFEKQDLRLHWEWVDEEWVRPKKQVYNQSTGSIFSSGTVVEVKLDRENLHDVWFPAIVIKENENNTYLVKYQTPKNGDEAETMKEIVDALHIRPSPPRYVDRNYELLETVDTIYDFGWRAGVITKVLAGRRYTVFFKHGNEDKELTHLDIRPHVEWVSGKWVSRSKEVLIASSNQEQLAHASKGTCSPEAAVQRETPCGAKNDIKEKTPFSTGVRKKLTEQSTPCHESDVLPSRKKKMKWEASDSNAEASLPPEKLDEGNALEFPLAITTSQLRKIQNATLTKPALRGLGTLRTGRAGSRGLRKSGVGYQPSARGETPFMGMTAQSSWNECFFCQDHLSNLKAKREKAVRLHSQTVGVVRRNGRLPKSAMKARPALATGKEHSKGNVAAEEISGYVGEENEVNMSVSLGLEAKGIKDLQAGKPSKILNGESLKLTQDQKNLNDSAGDKKLEIKEQINGGSNQKRKRGRPRKSLNISPAVSESGKEYGGAGPVSHEIVVKDRITNEVELPTPTGVEPTACQDTSGHKGAEISEDNTKEVEMAIAEVSNNTNDDDQPLSMWIGGIHSSSVEESRLFAGRSANGWNGPKEKQVQTSVEPSIVSIKGSNACDPNQTLPFVKKSPIWKTIESMEVFQIVPQQPHFCPLSESKEEYREGSAIGFMVTFAGLFEKISSLQFDDPRSIFQSIEESLLDLERHGFDVTVPRTRMDKLLSIIDGQVQDANESKDTERELMQHFGEKTKFGEEMEEIRRKIIELEEQYAAMKAQKEAKDLEIARLRSHVDVLNERIQTAHCEFEKLASAPWKLP